MSIIISQNMKNKLCTKCGEIKDLSCFAKSTHRKDGKVIYCKECIAIYSKDIRKKHNAKRTEYNKKYREENREKYNQWERNNYKKNSQQLSMNAKKWRDENGRFQMMHLSAQNRARKKKIPYELTAAIIHTCLMIQNNKCALTGIEFVLTDENYQWRPFTPSIDRIDNSKGYTLDNIQLVCTMVNKAKNIYAIELFDKMCRARMEKLNGT